MEDDVHIPLNTNSNNWSMVVIRDNSDYSVFPPINHENLQIFSHPQPQQHDDPIPESPPSPSGSDTWGLFSLSPFNSHVRKGGDFVLWMTMGFDILRSKLLAMVSSFRNRASHRWALSSIGVVMSCWIFMRFWCWLRKRRRRSLTLTQNEIRLMNIIKDKDEIIAQLTHQIAQMNEILITRHKALAAKVVE